jgi:hypothetical protein
MCLGCMPEAQLDMCRAVPLSHVVSEDLPQNHTLNSDLAHGVTSWVAALKKPIETYTCSGYSYLLHAGQTLPLDPDRCL